MDPHESQNTEVGTSAINMERFRNQVAIVTGGANGIGYSIVSELLREGASVVFSDKSDKGHELVSNWTAEGYEVHFCKGDMKNGSFCEQIVEEASQKFDRIDFLVNNAFSFVGEGLSARAEDWDQSYSVGPIAYARMAQAVAPYMQKQGKGAIVNIASISAHIAQIDRWTYNSAKSAVLGLTRCMALDMGPSVRVNSVSPAWVWTQEVDKAANLDGGGRDKWEPVWGDFHMLERCAEPIEVARPILFLLSEDASFITGTDLAIDGGYMSMGPEGLGKLTVNVGTR